MEAIVIFFRDVLSGTVYIIVSIVCFILICICVWQLIRRNRKAKEVEEQFASSHVVMINDKGEEETVEVSSSVPITRGVSGVTSILSSATTSMNNVPVNSAVMNVANSSGVDASTSSKPVVMINPAEVAAISSTMNVVGVTSAQKMSLQSANVSNADYIISTPYDASKNQTNTSGTIVNSQVVSAAPNSSYQVPVQDSNQNG